MTNEYKEKRLDEVQLEDVSGGFLKLTAGPGSHGCVPLMKPDAVAMPCVSPAPATSGPASQALRAAELQMSDFKDPYVDL